MVWSRDPLSVSFLQGGFRLQVETRVFCVVFSVWEIRFKLDWIQNGQYIDKEYILDTIV